jgi:hypothetical protein
MKAGDVVRWNYFGQSMNVGTEPIGVIVSDYYDKGIRDEPYKNVYWMEQRWVRPINPIHLEVINESR